MQANQPRNKYGIRIHWDGKPATIAWYPSQSARDFAWEGFNERSDVMHLEAIGKGASLT